MASVEAPETRSALVAFCRKARRMAIGSTPGWSQNRRSSIASVAATTRSGSSSTGQKPSRSSRGRLESPRSGSSPTNRPARSRTSSVGAGAVSVERQKAIATKTLQPRTTGESSSHHRLWDRRSESTATILASGRRSVQGDGKCTRRGTSRTPDPCRTQRRFGNCSSQGNDRLQRAVPALSKPSQKSTTTLPKQ